MQWRVFISYAEKLTKFPITEQNKKIKKELYGHRHYRVPCLLSDMQTIPEKIASNRKIEKLFSVKSAK